MLLGFLAPRARAAEAALLKFTELYEPAGAAGLVTTPKTNGLAGRPVVMKGFMAPPLKPDADFFVLTREPMSVCPFCDSAANWPADIVVVHLAGPNDYADNAVPIAVTGTLDLGPKMDPKTGFVSLIRLERATYERL
ncbi:hypothetical protein GCM10011611_39340 [Aliidongia dinghuensis]|uniref:DUF3299 domain-containing protein n=2 Tax=Aliidongia dinghuensis TaxID=1867774 RepID=A0A8J2YWW2_9PROT|nr:hypothetical protein GCM10011611_39340 [Aliidongia dinghuensis]